MLSISAGALACCSGLAVTVERSVVGVSSVDLPPYQLESGAAGLVPAKECGLESARGSAGPI